MAAVAAVVGGDVAVVAAAATGHQGHDHVHIQVPTPRSPAQKRFSLSLWIRFGLPHATYIGVPYSLFVLNLLPFGEYSGVGRAVCTLCAVVGDWPLSAGQGRAGQGRAGQGRAGVE